MINGSRERDAEPSNPTAQGAGAVAQLKGGDMMVGRFAELLGLST